MTGLAQALAFRGHLNEAYRVLGNREHPLFAELVYLEAVPPDTAAVVFRSWMESGSTHARLALPYWSKAGDTASIEAFRRRAARPKRGTFGVDVALGVEYDTIAARAHLLLARHDSAEALRLFQSLPDTLCRECYLDRLVRARLLSARGHYAEAMKDLTEPLSAFLTPIEVMLALERARVAVRSDETTVAQAAYRFVGEAWMHADRQLAPLVREAHEKGLASASRNGP